MCGRYAIAPRTADAWATVGDLLGPDTEEMLNALKPLFNISPTTQIPIVIEDADGKPRAVIARWGFIPYWWKEVAPPKFPTFNARSEEAAAKPMWRDAWLRSRCLIAATHWYEWRQDPAGKQPFALQPADGKAFMFAGLYSRWKPPGSDETIYTAAILTRDAAPSIAAIHDRMPVVLHPAAWNGWLDRTRRDRRAVDDILTVNTIMEMRGYRVSTRVNSSRNDGPELLDPLPGADPG
jgi:putative SOS response-associated peptidase YedK